MSSAQVYEIVVEYTEQRCSPSPSTSSSSSSSASSSGATSPSNSVGSSEAGSSSSTRRVRRLSKTKKTSGHSLRRSSRKIFSAARTKFAKRHSSVSSSKLRLVKHKIDKEHKEKMAASRARVERLRREHEELLAGNSQLAILCESVTSGARSLRESYERQRAAVFHAYISTALQEIEEDEDEEDAGFIGTFFY